MAFEIRRFEMIVMNGGKINHVEQECGRYVLWDEIKDVVSQEKQRATIDKTIAEMQAAIDGNFAKVDEDIEKGVGLKELNPILWREYVVRPRRQAAFYAAMGALIGITPAMWVFGILHWTSPMAWIVPAFAGLLSAANFALSLSYLIESIATKRIIDSKEADPR